MIYEITDRFGPSIALDKKIPLEVVASPQGLNVLYQTAISNVTQMEKYPIGQKTQSMLDVAVAAYEPLFLCDVAALIGADEGESSR